MIKDYYKILGVTEFDTSENIKIAYRKLARKCHPDVAGNSVDILNRFKEINEAYQVLSDCKKKTEYDTARNFYNYAKSTADKTEEKCKETHTQKKEQQKNKNMFGFDWENFILKKKSFSSFKKEQKNTPQKGADIYTDIELTSYEAISGVTKVINMLQTTPCPYCKGKNFINGMTCPHCHGKGNKTKHKKFNIKIPAGVKNNAKIRLAGEGAQSLNGGQNGDLFVRVHIINTSGCKDLNISKTVKISPSEAVLGTNIKVTVQGETYDVKISPFTQNGQKIRLAGCGLMQNEKIGDMILTVEIEIPKSLSQTEINLYKKLAEYSD